MNDFQITFHRLSYFFVKALNVSKFRGLTVVFAVSPSGFELKQRLMRKAACENKEITTQLMHLLSSS